MDPLLVRYNSLVERSEPRRVDCAALRKALDECNEQKAHYLKAISFEHDREQALKTLRLSKADSPNPEVPADDATLSKFVYDTGVVEDSSRKFCRALMDGLDKVKEHLAQDIRARKVCDPLRLAELDELWVKCAGFRDEMEMNSHFFVSQFTPPVHGTVSVAATPEVWDS